MKKLFFICFLVVLGKLTCQNSLMLITSDANLMQIKIADTIINKKFQAQVEVHNLLSDTVTIVAEFENKTKIKQRIYLMLKKQPTVNEWYFYKFNSEKKCFVFFNHIHVQHLPQPIVPLKPIEDTTFKYRNKSLEHFCEIKDDKPIYFNNNPTSKKCETPMPMSYLNYINILMLKCQTPDEKFAISENVFRNNCLSVAQVSKIIDYNSYEVEKLKLFKLAYPKICDKENVNEFKLGLKYESSKKEFDSFLKDVKTNTLTINTDCVKANKNEDLKEFNELLKTALNDGDRLSIFKKRYDDYCYDTEQLKIILQTFLHDREKLEVSKLMYFKCVDKENFATITSVFSYKQSESEMLDFIEKQK